MRTIFIGALAAFALVSLPALAGSQTLPPVYPDNGKGAKEFDWQKEWGSIHMNSFADGLNDPGVPGSNTGNVSCDNTSHQTGTNSLCNKIAPDAGTYAQISNGIKYDIKRSFLGCMSQSMPNWSINNVWDSDNPDYGPCGLQADLKQYRLETQNETRGTKFIHDYTAAETKWSQTQKDLAKSIRGNDGRSYLIYQPIYDARSNDDRSWLKEHFVGCQQQISNNCGYNDKGDIIRDVHACVGSPASGLTQDGPGYNHPVSHVFSPQEVIDLQTTGKLLDANANVTALPTVYYAYQSKDKDGNVRTALSAIDPLAPTSKDKFPDMVTDSKVDKIDTSDVSKSADHFLSNLKAYRFDVNDGDVNTFVVVDPSDFFDLKLYLDGGKYGSNYHNFQVDKNGNPVLDTVTKDKLAATWNTCPVLGMTSGYSGICDPTSGEAGCNLPIYGQTGETKFADASGNNYSYSNYPLKWSGYMKKWAIITRDQYIKNICGPGGCGPSITSENDREEYYIVNTDEGLNDNPILMLTRSPDYCEVAEMTSNPRKYVRAGQALQADMPCIQYLQYQKWSDESGKSQYSFVDLYNPVEALFDSIPPEADTVQLYHLDKNGHPDYSNPVAGTGSGKYVGTTATTGFVRPLDAEDPANPGNPFVDPSGNKAVIAKYINKKDDPNGLNPISAVARNLAAVQSTHVDIYGNPIMTTGQYQVWLDANKNQCDPTAGDPACKPDVTKGVAIEMKAGTATAIRFPHDVLVSSVDSKGKPIMKKSSCVVVSYKPTDAASPQHLFVPTNSYEEFQGFVTAAQSGKVTTLKPTELGFFDCSNSYQAKAETLAQLTKEGTASANMTQTAQWIDDAGKANSATFKTWTGAVQCKDLVTKPACNQARIISAQRRCQLENGANGKCGDCANAADPDDANVTGFDFANGKVGPSGHVEVLVSPMQQDNKCYFSAACMGMDAETCPPANVPGGHVFCLAPETKITMADGTEKPIKQVKAGDEVVAFNAKRTRDGELGKAKVAATAITKNQQIIQINNLKITPLHKIVLATGRTVTADEIKVGDKILKGSGQVEKVTKVKKNLKKITVYNLVLEKESDGYIAGGLRVMSYPLMKEMEITSGHAEVQANNGKHRRYGKGGRSVSSVK